MKTITNTNIKSIKEILGLLGEQMEQLRPKNKPSPESIQASRGTATLVNSYLGTVKVGMEYAKVNGQRPDLDFLGIPVKQGKIQDVVSESTKGT